MEVKDQFNGKFFILEVVNNSPAYKAGLRIGDELVKKDGEKLKRYSSTEFNNLLSRSNTASFEIKNRSGKQVVSMTKSYVNYPIENFDNPHRDKYWKQISNYDIEFVKFLLGKLSRISDWSSGMRNHINNEYTKLNHWSKYYTKFKNGYDVCISNYGMDNRDSNSCIMNVVDKTKADIAYDEEQARQQAMYEQQMRMQQQQMYLQQQQINAMNNYADALQNQHVDVNQNVNYSGTVNHNINGTMNYNVNGNMNHYYRGWGW